MLSFIKRLMGKKPLDVEALIEEGAIILDVRTTREFENGHIKEAINIPLNLLSHNIDQFADKTTPIITCCASGVRSASAKMILKRNGFEQVYNGGSWKGLKKLLPKKQAKILTWFPKDTSDN